MGRCGKRRGEEGGKEIGNKICARVCNVRTGEAGAETQERVVWTDALAAHEVNGGCGSAHLTKLFERNLATLVRIELLEGFLERARLATGSGIAWTHGRGRGTGLGMAGNESSPGNARAAGGGSCAALAASGR